LFCFLERQITITLVGHSPESVKTRSLYTGKVASLQPLSSYRRAISINNIYIYRRGEMRSEGEVLLNNIMTNRREPLVAAAVCQCEVGTYYVIKIIIIRNDCVTLDTAE